MVFAAMPERDVIDEYDVEESPVRSLPDGAYLVDARIPVDDLDDLLGTELPQDDFVKRIVGLPGDQVEVSGGRVFVNGVEQELVDTGVQRLLGDLDELPHPVLGYSILEPPSRRRDLHRHPRRLRAARGATDGQDRERRERHRRGRADGRRVRDRARVRAEPVPRRSERRDAARHGARQGPLWSGSDPGRARSAIGRELKNHSN